MTPSSRTTHQRDRRFARVRMLTRTIFVGSGALSVAMVGYLSTITKLHPSVSHPTTTLAPSTTTTLAPSGVTGVTGATGAATTPSAPVTTTTVAPTTTTTTCYTSPSGNTTCN